MSLWTLADIALWVAVAAPYFLAGLALIAFALLFRRAYWAIARASLQVDTWLEEADLAEAEPIGTDIPDGYEFADDLAKMRRLAQLIEDEASGITETAVEEPVAVTAQPTRTEENQ